MKTLATYTILTIVLISKVFPQLSKLDSLKVELNNTKHDTTICSIYLQISQTFEGKNTDSAVFYGLKCLDFANEKGIRRKQSSAYNVIGNIYRKQGYYLSALEAYMNAIKIDEELDDKLSISKNYNNIGLIHKDQGNYDIAIEMFKKSLEIKESFNDIKGAAGTYSNIGIVYRLQGHFDKAIEQYMISIRILEKLNDKDGIAKCYNNIGNIHYFQQNFEKALDFFQKSLTISIEYNDVRGMSRTYSNIGIIYKEQGKFEKAIENYFKAIEILEKLGDQKTLAILYNNIGNIYKAQGNFVKALDYLKTSMDIRKKIGDKHGLSSAYASLADFYNIIADSLKDYRASKYLHEALKYGNMAYKLADDIGALPVKISAMDRLKNTYTKLKQYEKALLYSDILLSLKDSLYNYEKAKVLTEIQTKYETEKKQQEIEKQQLLIEKREVDFSRQRTRLNFLIVCSLLLVFLVIIIFLAYSQKNKSNSIIVQKNALLEQYNEEIKATSDALSAQNEQLKEQNEEITAQRNEIESQRNSLANLAWELQEQGEEIEKQKNILSIKNKEITDSIFYAQRIQSAVLPSSDFLAHYFSEHFILYRPKSIVSGDFYWATRIGELLIFCVTDCTGHGVPGAFMSMLGVSFLNEIIRKEENTNPAKVLVDLREHVMASMMESKGSSIQFDGMDIGLCVIDTTSLMLQFAGANIPCWIAAGSANEEKFTERVELLNGLIELKPDKMPIARYEKMEEFTIVEYQLEKGDIIYVASDGFADQFGGQDGKKYQKSRLIELISQNSTKKLAEQKQILEVEFEKWKGSRSQLDDVTLMGVKV
jgi:tetratricopeptide (TPR) repeat protein